MTNHRTAAEAMREAIARRIDRIGDESPEEWDLLSIVAAIRAVPLPDPPDRRDEAMRLARDALVSADAAINPLDKSGLSLHVWNKLLKDATITIRAAIAALDAAMKPHPND